MTLTEGVDGIVVILRPHGRLSVETFGLLKDRVRALVAEGRRQIVLNLADVSYVDSIGIAEIVRAHVMLKSDGGRLTLTSLPPMVDELLGLTHLHTVIDSAATEAQAIRMVGGRPGRRMASGSQEGT